MRSTYQQPWQAGFWCCARRAHVLASLFLLACLAAATPAQVLGTSINLDFGGAVVPSSSFGGPSGPNGVWNSISSLGTTVGILDIAGNLTGVTVTLSVDEIVTTPGVGDEAALRNDYFFAGPGATWAVEVGGLLGGYYNLYFYASDSIVFGTATANTCDGCRYGFNSQRGTSALIGSTFVSSLAPITVTGSDTAFASGLAGMQIELLQATGVPEPSSLVLLIAVITGFLGARIFRKRS